LTNGCGTINHISMTHGLIKVDDWQGPGQLWRLDGAQLDGAPVLITHGTFSNADTCVPMAQFFGKTTPTYVIEWRGRDQNRGKLTDFDYYDLAEGEMVEALAYISQCHPKDGVHVVAHSGGGLAMILALLHAPQAARLIRSMTLLGAQATHSHLAGKRVQMFMAAMGFVGRRLGYWPAKYIRLGPCSEAQGIMDNWRHWNKHRMFTDRKGRDVLPLLSQVAVSTLVLAGKADTVIAPMQGCRAIADGFGDYAKFEQCGRAQGYSEDFNHARLIRSRAAATSLWPRIAEWMAQH
jgi:oxygen-independent coproporphyrinogen-3 oxidase